MVFYQKYRPQSLADLLGQAHIQQILQTAFQSGKLSHAYLFCGPKGTGKTSTARILAKMVNCEKAIINKPGSSLQLDAIPCNICFSCISITDGSNLDLIEIDAASNRGIDDIRDLREKIKLAPTSAKKKVYIIDEAHMLTTEAFNALLKTLEEPPSHVLFILATTELNKIPPTIVSRVQKLDFNRASDKDLLEYLKQVSSQEKIAIDEAALKLIIKHAEGSFRDGLKLLDQLASREEKITVNLVESSLNIGSFDQWLKLLDSLAEKNTQSALENVGNIVVSGVNIKEFINSGLDLLRDILLIKNNAASQIKDNLEIKNLEELTQLAIRLDNSHLIYIINNLLLALEKMKFTSIASLPLEIAVVESCLLETRSQALNVREIELKGNGETIKMSKLVQKTSVSVDSIPETEPAIVSAFLGDDGSPKDDIASTDVLTLQDKWTYILETVRPYNFSLEALLKQVNIISCNNGILILEVPYSFHQRILEAPKSRDLLESVVGDVLGKPIKVNCVLGQRPTRIEEIANVELAADDEIVKLATEIFNSES